jgi:hypothetical protein
MSTSCLNTGLSLMSHCHPKTIQNSWHVAHCLKIYPQFDFGEFSHHPLEIYTPTILNGRTSRNPVDLIQVSVEVRQLVHLYLFTDQETFESCTCGKWDWNARERHHAWSAVLDKWSVAYWPRNQACYFFQEIFVIPTSEPVRKYVGSE